MVSLKISLSRSTSVSSMSSRHSQDSGGEDTFVVLEHEGPASKDSCSLKSSSSTYSLSKDDAGMLVEASIRASILTRYAEDVTITGNKLPTNGLESGQSLE